MEPLQTVRSFFNKSPRIVSPSLDAVVQMQHAGNQTTRNLANKSNEPKDAIDAIFKRVMEDERTYDQIKGPDRIK